MENRPLKLHKTRVLISVRCGSAFSPPDVRVQLCLSLTFHWVSCGSLKSVFLVFLCFKTKRITTLGRQMGFHLFISVLYVLFTFVGDWIKRDSSLQDVKLHLVVVHIKHTHHIVAA